LIFSVLSLLFLFRIILANLDLAFIVVALAGIATVSGGVLRWRYGVRKIRHWFLVLCAPYAIGVTFLLVLIYAMMTFRPFN
jgi:hypothetical protein